jgi:hypothetical protein
MVIGFLKKIKLKKILKNVRGATVPAALSRRPYPLPLAAGRLPWALSTGFYPQLSTVACA